jgi:hypothetical protein
MDLGFEKIEELLSKNDSETKSLRLGAFKEVGLGLRLPVL